MLCFTAAVEMWVNATLLRLEIHLPISDLDTSVQKRFSVVNWESTRTSILVLAGIKLIFFLIARIVVCFGFSKRRVLITH